MYEFVRKNKSKWNILILKKLNYIIGKNNKYKLVNLG